MYMCCVCMPKCVYIYAFKDMYSLPWGTRKYACTGWLPCDLLSDCSLGMDGFVAQAEQGSFRGRRCCWAAPLPLDLAPGDLSAGPPRAASILFPAAPPAALNNPSLLPFLPPPPFLPPASFLPCCPKQLPSLAVGGAGGPQCLVQALRASALLPGSQTEVGVGAMGSWPGSSPEGPWWRALVSRGGLVGHVQLHDF